KNRRLHIRFFPVEPRRLLELRASGFHIAFLTKGRAKGVVNLGSVRRILERLTECRYRLVELALLLKNRTQRVVSFRIIRLRFYSSAESRGRFRQFRLL